MTEDSVILLDEIVVSEVGATWRATLGDMCMAACLCASERTEAEWQALADTAGFTISKVLKYNEELEDCVMILTIRH